MILPDVDWRAPLHKVVPVPDPVEVKVEEPKLAEKPKRKKKEK